MNLGSWWWTGRPGVLQFMGSQTVRHNWVTDLIWSDLNSSCGSVLSQEGAEAQEPCSYLEAWWEIICFQVHLHHGWKQFSHSCSSGARCFWLSVVRDPSRVLGLLSGPYHVPSSASLSQHHSLLLRARRGTLSHFSLLRDNLILRDLTMGAPFLHLCHIMEPDQGSFIPSHLHILLVRGKFCL